MTRSRVPAVLAGLTASLMLAGCGVGVPPSDVIQAGEPASGFISPGPTSSASAVIPFYFLRNGALTAYPRTVPDPGDVGAVVRLLFDGPPTSGAAALTTELPGLTAEPDVRVDSETIVSIRLPRGASPLGHLAMLQLACTVAHLAYAPAPTQTQQDSASASPPFLAQPSPAPASVQVIGDGWTMTQSDAACPDRRRP